MTTFSPEYADILQRAMHLSDEERQALRNALAHGQSPLNLSEEIRQTPLSPTEVIAQGLVGTWSDLEIADSAEWINDQKKKRQAKNQW